MGDFEAGTPVFVESSLKYHSDRFELLTSVRNPDQGQCLVGSLTGAVASQKVTEAFKGRLGPDGNRTGRVFAQACLTERPTSRSETKVGESDPAPTRGSGVAQRIKVTLGITG